MTIIPNSSHIQYDNRGIIFILFKIFIIITNLSLSFVIVITIIIILNTVSVKIISIVIASMFLFFNVLS